jgi:hypothetical protein
MSMSEKLAQARALLDEIRAEVDSGVILSKQDASTLEKMSATARDMRDHAIVKDPTIGREAAARWGLSEARICQIRMTAKTGVTVCQRRRARAPISLSTVWR